MAVNIVNQEVELVQNKPNLLPAFSFFNQSSIVTDVDRFKKAACHQSSPNKQALSKKGKESKRLPFEFSEADLKSFKSDPNNRAILDGLTTDHSLAITRKEHRLRRLCPVAISYLSAAEKEAYKAELAELIDLKILAFNDELIRNRAGGNQKLDSLLFEVARYSLLCESQEKSIDFENIRVSMGFPEKDPAAKNERWLNYLKGKKGEAGGQEALDDYEINPCRYALDCMAETNFFRLYSLWALGNGGFLDSIIYIPEIREWMPFIDWERFDNRLNYPTKALGYLSWMMYFTRLTLNISLIVKHCFPAFMNEKEKALYQHGQENQQQNLNDTQPFFSAFWWQLLNALTLTLVERAYQCYRWAKNDKDRELDEFGQFNQQWGQRKYVIGNDIIWGIVNLVSFYWFISAVSPLFGAIGGLLNVGLMLFDLAMVRVRLAEGGAQFEKDSQKIRLAVEKIDREIVELEQKRQDTQTESDIKKKELVKLEALRLRKKALIEELELLRETWEQEKQGLVRLTHTTIWFTLAMAFMYAPNFALLLSIGNSGFLGALSTALVIGAPWIMMVGCIIAVTLTVIEVSGDHDDVIKTHQARVSNIQKDIEGCLQTLARLKPGSNKHKKHQIELIRLRNELAYSQQLIQDEKNKRLVNGVLLVVAPVVLFAVLNIGSFALMATLLSVLALVFVIGKLSLDSYLSTAKEPSPCDISEACLQDAPKDNDEEGQALSSSTIELTALKDTRDESKFDKKEHSPCRTLRSNKQKSSLNNPDASENASKSRLTRSMSFGFFSDRAIKAKTKSNNSVPVSVSNIPTF